MEEVDHLLKVLEERGLTPKGAFATVGIPAPSSRERDVTLPTPASVGIGDDYLGAPAVGTLDSFAPTGAPSPPIAEASVFKSVTKRVGDIYVLSPKFPPTASGAERTSDAAMVLLGAFDAAGERGATGYFLVSALRQTGYALDRVDTHLDDLVTKGLVLTEGIKRGRRYTLSEAGRVESRRLASELAALSGRPLEATP